MFYSLHKRHDKQRQTLLFAHRRCPISFACASGNIECPVCNFRTNTNHSLISWCNIRITDCPLSHTSIRSLMYIYVYMCMYTIHSIVYFACLFTCAAESYAGLRRVCRERKDINRCKMISILNFLVFHVETRSDIVNLIILSISLTARSPFTFQI